MFVVNNVKKLDLYTGHQCPPRPGNCHKSEQGSVPLSEVQTQNKSWSWSGSFLLAKNNSQSKAMSGSARFYGLVLKLKFFTSSCILKKGKYINTSRSRFVSDMF